LQSQAQGWMDQSRCCF